MKPEISNRFNEQILAIAAQRYGVTPAQMAELAGFESFIYSFSRPDGDYILRLGHSLRRTPALVHGEVDWINYLGEGGAGVAYAVLSAGGELVEPIDDGQGEQFLATAFVKAMGAPVWQMGGWTESFVQAYGRLLGRIHHLSRQYQLPNPDWKRPNWDDPLNTDAAEILAQTDPTLADVYLSLMGYLQSLPTSPDGYGLIHQDAHTGNLFVDENGRITLFDFDDCAYGHFVYDLAMVLFYAVTNRPHAEQFATWFWPIFWQAYQQEYPLDSAWLRELPQFMKLREIELYAFINRDVAWQTLPLDSWTGQYMNGRRQRIEQQIPYLTLNFTE